MDYNLIALTPKVRTGATSAVVSWSAGRTTPRRRWRTGCATTTTKTNPVLELFRRKEFVVTVDARPDKMSVQKEIRVQLGLAE